ncbi:MAG TPA: PIN domain-containing protein [Fimbriimonas sp.]|nr:PIN domain-containing protein [Fimbriimonas sp.]
MSHASTSSVPASFTLGELLVGPIRLGDSDTIGRIGRVLSPPAIEVIPFDTSVARRYAEIRAMTKTSAPDAIHLACAASAGVDLFVTNDKDLRKRPVEGIKFFADLNLTLS